MGTPLHWFVRPLVSFLPGRSIRNARPDPSRLQRDRHELVVSIVEKHLQRGADPEEVLRALGQVRQPGGTPAEQIPLPRR